MSTSGRPDRFPICATRESSLTKSEVHGTSGIECTVQWPAPDISIHKHQLPASCLNQTASEITLPRPEAIESAAQTRYKYTSASVQHANCSRRAKINLQTHRFSSCRCARRCRPTCLISNAFTHSTAAAAKTRSRSGGHMYTTPPHSSRQKNSSKAAHTGPRSLYSSLRLPPQESILSSVPPWMSKRA